MRGGIINYAWAAFVERKNAQIAPSEDAACGSLARFALFARCSSFTLLSYVSSDPTRHPLSTLTSTPTNQPPSSHFILAHIEVQWSGSKTPSPSSPSCVFISLAGGTCINQMQRQVSSSCRERKMWTLWMDSHSIQTKMCHINKKTLIRRSRSWVHFTYFYTTLRLFIYIGYKKSDFAYLNKIPRSDIFPSVWPAWLDPLNRGGLASFPPDNPSSNSDLRKGLPAFDVCQVCCICLMPALSNWKACRTCRIYCPAKSTQIQIETVTDYGCS